MSVVRHFVTSPALNTYKSIYWMDANIQLVKQKFDFCKACFFVLICINGFNKRPSDNYKNVMHENGRGGN